MDNLPLLLSFEDGVDHIHFFVQYLEYRQSISEKTSQDHLFVNFASLGGPFTSTGHALYSISNRLREVFSLTQRVSLEESDLRKYFSYVMMLAHDRLAKQVTADSDIVVFLESVDRMADQFGLATAKCWLPKSYMRRHRCILTAADTNADSVTARFPCFKITVKSDIANKQIIDNLWQRFECGQPQSMADLEPVDQLKSSHGQEKPVFKSIKSFAQNDHKNKIMSPAEFNARVKSAFNKLSTSLQNNQTFAAIYSDLLSIPFNYASEV